MKKRITAIAALLSIMSLGKPFLIGKGACLTSAIVMFSFSEKAQADSAYFYDRQAFKEWNKNNFFEAIKYYNQAIEIQPNNSKLYGKRGNCYYQLGEFNAAIFDYNKSLQLNSNDKSVWLFRGLAKRKLGSLKGACSDLRKASALGQEFATEIFKRYCK